MFGKSPALTVLAGTQRYTTVNGSGDLKRLRSEIRTFLAPAGLHKFKSDTENLCC